MDRESLKQLHDELINVKLNLNKHLGKGFRKFGEKHEDYEKKNIVRTLFILNLRGPMTPSSLGRLMDVRKSTMTAIVDFLTENGFVVIRHEKTDKRKKIIHLTEKGIEKAKNRENIMMDTIFESIKHLEEKSVQEVIHHLGEINKILSKAVS